MTECCLPDGQEMLSKLRVRPVGQPHLALVPPSPSGTMKQKALGAHGFLPSEQGLDMAAHKQVGNKLTYSTHYKIYSLPKARST